MNKHIPIFVISVFLLFMGHLSLSTHCYANAIKYSSSYGISALLMKNELPKDTSTVFDPKSIVIGPNPVDKYLNVQLDVNMKLVSLEIFDLIGKQRGVIAIDQTMLKGNTAKISRKDLNIESGIYLLRLITNVGETSRKLVVK